MSVTAGDRKWIRDLLAQSEERDFRERMEP